MGRIERCGPADYGFFGMGGISKAAMKVRLKGEEVSCSEVLWRHFDVGLDLLKLERREGQDLDGTRVGTNYVWGCDNKVKQMIACR